MINEAVYCHTKRLSHNCWSNDHPQNNKDKSLWVSIAHSVLALQYSCCLIRKKTETALQSRQTFLLHISDVNLLLYKLILKVSLTFK